MLYTQISSAYVFTPVASLGEASSIEYSKCKLLHSCFFFGEECDFQSGSLSLPLLELCLENCLMEMMLQSTISYSSNNLWGRSLAYL